MGWNIRSWQRVYWSDESRILLHPLVAASTYGDRDTTFQQEHIVGPTAFGGDGVTFWGCFSLSCRIDLYVLDWALTGQTYRDQILRPLVLPHFDCHPLAILMDDNAKPHGARIV